MTLIRHRVGQVMEDRGSMKSGGRMKPAMAIPVAEEGEGCKQGTLVAEVAAGRARPRAGKGRSLGSERTSGETTIEVATGTTAMLGSRSASPVRMQMHVCGSRQLAVF